LVNTITYSKSSLLPRTPQAQIYQAIIADLIDAQSRLANDYSASGGQRIIPNKWAATALLARVYLYTNDWENAEAQATLVINNSSLYSLPQLNDVFKANSSEGIWQLQQSNNTILSYNSTPEGYLLIPRILNSNSNPPFLYLTPAIINAFETNDKRKSTWIDSTIYRNTKYFFPYKYQQGPAQSTANGSYVEYYMALRLAEQFLIRAEAKAHQDKADAVTDLNIIRERSYLGDYAGANDQNSVLNAIYHEWQVEFFSEWGHRWLDLKRWRNAITTLTESKGAALDSNALLFPIPVSELSVDPNLTQNPGY
jgi:hypothetical protein